jgi:RNA polymerase sigma-70 factor (ECF subfamily)
MQLSALAAQGVEPVDASPAPDAALARKRLRRLLQDAVEHLDPAHRNVYTLRDVEGLSGAETARRLGISVAAQKSRLHRARAQMRAFLDQRLSARSPV